MMNLNIKKYLLMICLFSSNFFFGQNVDIDLLRDINLNRNQSFDPGLRLITDSAAPLSIGTPIIVYSIGLIGKNTELKQKGLYLTEAFLVNAFITVALKNGFKRERPFVTYPDIDVQTYGGSYSFPSGHTSTVFATATSLSISFPKWYVIVPTFAWAGTVGYSRMHLGVHYPSDVISGAIIGSGSAYVSYKLNKWINKKIKKPIFYEGIEMTSQKVQNLPK
jgi:membrane-associated phospholipid phosphatase